MSALREILQAYAQISRDGGQAVLATVVRVAGSTYRRPGARMLIRDAGDSLGLISGGCLEPDVEERSLAVLESGAHELLRYDTRSDDDLVWGLGLGCNGLFEILLERLPAQGPDPLEFIARCRASGRPGVIASAIAVHGEAGVRLGQRMCFRVGEEPETDLDDAELARKVARASADALAADATALASFEVRGGRAELLVEVVRPPPPLLVVGAGPDAVPLARLAAELDFDVSVVDRREAYADPSHFPSARRVLVCEPADVAARAGVCDATIALVMTHSYRYDLDYLRALLATDARYIGVLGPRKRTDKLLAELAAGGVAVGDTREGRIYAPVGLDVGADSPEEIALAVLAEIRAFLSGRPGGSLRDRRGPIHEPAS